MYIEIRPNAKCPRSSKCLSRITQLLLCLQRNHYVQHSHHVEGRPDLRRRGRGLRRRRLRQGHEVERQELGHDQLVQIVVQRVLLEMCKIRASQKSNIENYTDPGCRSRTATTAAWSTASGTSPSRWGPNLLCFMRLCHVYVMFYVNFYARYAGRRTAASGGVWAGGTPTGEATTSTESRRGLVINFRTKKRYYNHNKVSLLTKTHYNIFSPCNLISLFNGPARCCHLYPYESPLRATRRLESCSVLTSPQILVESLPAP